MKQVFLGLILLSFVLFGCSDSNDIELDNLSGTYVGVIDGLDVEKSLDLKFQGPFTAKVRIRGEQLEVHCFGTNLDELFMLDYYEHNGNYMVCLTGVDHKNYYGTEHRMINGNHMHGMQRNVSPWMNHLNTAHNSDENHFNGEFNLIQGSFMCTFLWNDQPITFKGVKQ